MAVDPVVICYPKEEMKRTPVWYASGLTSDGRKVRGLLYNKDNELVKEGTTIRYSVAKWPVRINAARICRWLIQFNFYPDVDTYKLRVEWVGDSTKYAERPVKVIEPPQVLQRQNYQIDVVSHTSGADITNEADAFIAFGGLQQGHTLTIARMNSLGAGFFQSDTELQTWVAQFDALQSGTYTLYVEDSFGTTHAQSVTGLTVS